MILLLYQLAFFAVPPTSLPKAPSPAPLPNLPGNVFHQPSWGSQHPFLLGMIQLFFMIAALALIVLMSVQTTKSEGLSGTIGGRTESAYRGRLGIDQQLARLTSAVGYAFLGLAIIYFFAAR